MEPDSQGSGQHYKIKLANGRILGPLDLERVRLLILKNKIVGTELAREYPQGDWKDINLIPEIAELLVARASGALVKEDPSSVSGYRPIKGAPPPMDVLAGATQVLNTASMGSLPELQTLSVAGEQKVQLEKTKPVQKAEEDAERTMMVTSSMEMAKGEMPQKEHAHEVGCRER